jgi:hypothetical protein
MSWPTHTLGRRGRRPSALTRQRKRTYLAHGKVDFFGEEDLAHSGGAGGPACTTRPIEFHLALAADGLVREYEAESF